MGQLSNTLRTYHDLGTPKLQFHSDRKLGIGPSVGAGTDTHGDLRTSPSQPITTRQYSAHPNLGALATSPPKPIQPQVTSPLSNSTRSPLVHKGIEDLRRLEGYHLGSSDKDRDRDRKRTDSVNSDLASLKLSSIENATNGSDHHLTASPTQSHRNGHPIRKKPSLSSQDLQSLKRERESRHDTWHDHHREADQISTGTGSGTGTGAGNGNGAGSVDGISPARSMSQRAHRRLDSPGASIDRSRPW